MLVPNLRIQFTLNKLLIHFRFLKKNELYTPYFALYPLTHFSKNTRLYPWYGISYYCLVFSPSLFKIWGRNNDFPNGCLLSIKKKNYSLFFQDCLFSLKLFYFLIVLYFAWDSIFFTKSKFKYSIFLSINDSLFYFLVLNFPTNLYIYINLCMGFH